ncbi:MAG: FIVAR domain-containing protein, partial [Gemmatimonadales bacterium]
LRRVVDRARGVAEYIPKCDLWPGIASRIGATPVAAPRVGRRWSFSMPHLAAAAIFLMTLSGGTVWLIGSSALPPTAGSIATAPTPVAVPAAINASNSASRSYSAAIADLERVLAGGRGQLDTTTVRVIEQNLAAIDRAIAQAQQALLADPANLYLNTHLTETMRRKLDLLRQAATLVPVS